MVDDDAISQALLINVIHARGESIQQSRTPDKVASPHVTCFQITYHNFPLKCAQVRDGMAKAMYGGLFGWLVSRITGFLSPDTANTTQSRALTQVGLLDIFGFEHFQVNR